MTEIMSKVGVNKDRIGCEVCKTAIGSILASLWNEHIMDPAHHASVFYVPDVYAGIDVGANWQQPGHER